MSTVVTSVDVGVPVRVAYNQWTQFESFPHFMDGVQSVSQLDETRTHWAVTVGGMQREFDAEISEQIPDEVIAWASTGGHNGRVSFQSLGPAATRVSIQLGWEPEGLIEKSGALLNIDQRHIEKSAHAFKQFIETHRQETGAWRGTISNSDSPGRDASIPGAWATDDGQARNPAAPR